MAKFEEVLPALRAGKKIRREGWVEENWYVFLNSSGHLVDEADVRFGWTIEGALEVDDWEIVPESKRVADYLCPVPGNYMHCPLYASMPYEIGKQPKDSVLIPGTEREEDGQ